MAELAKLKLEFITFFLVSYTGHLPLAGSTVCIGWVDGCLPSDI